MLEFILCISNYITYIEVIVGNDDMTTMCQVTAAVDAVRQWIVVTVAHFLTVTLPTTVIQSA